MVSTRPRQLRCDLIIRDDSEESAPRLIPSSSFLAINLYNKGIRLSFLRHPDRSIWSWYSADLAVTESALYHVAIELPPRGFAAKYRELTSTEISAFKPFLSQDTSAYKVLDITLSPNSNPTVVGFGLPFHGVNETVDNWVNQHTPIKKVISLPEILKQKNFTLLVKASGVDIDYMIGSIKVHYGDSGYGYGEIHTWDMKRYNQQIPKNRGPPFPEMIRFEDENERDTALTQTHEGKHFRAARRALRGDLNKIEVTFLEKQRHDKKVSGPVTWEAVHLTFGASDCLRGVNVKDRIPLGLIRPAKGQPGHNFSPIAHNDYASAKEARRDNLQLCLQSGLEGDISRVQAINRLSHSPIVPPVLKSDPFVRYKKLIFNELLIGKGLWDVQKAELDVHLPPFNLLKDVPLDIQDACLHHIFEDDRDRFKQYFSKLHLGLGLVTGPPGTGKSHLASAIVVLMCLNPSLQHVYVSAASNGATDNFLDRIAAVAQKTISQLIDHGLDVKHLMLVRGYSLNTEIEKCTIALSGKPLEEYDVWNPSPWKLEHSLCWWTLRALGSKRVPALTPDDNVELFELHDQLNSLASDLISNRDLSKFRPLVKFAQGIYSFAEYWTGQTKAHHKEVLSDLMKAVIQCSKVVATTPVAATKWIYRSFNNDKARAVVFDEAATLFCSDGLLVFGNTPRPMIAIGDPQQLAPVLSTAFEMLQTKRERYKLDRLHIEDLGPYPTNRFAGFAHISWLSWFIHLGWPVFHLYTQHRMAEGLFDLSLKNVYHSLIPHFKYSSLCRTTKFPIGIDVEDYLQRKFRIPAPADNTLAPVFFNCASCPIRKYPDNESRLNPRQAELISELLVEMIAELRLSTEDIAVLTPYRANLRAIGKQFRREPTLKGIECSTFDKFQGREAQIVVLALCVNEESGPLFVANRRSLNVALTRHRSSLIIFGDLATIPRFYEHKDILDPPGVSNGQKLDLKMFRNVLETFRKSRRIVFREGKPEVDPDEYWERLKTSSGFL
ncbi:hypothetical protein IL306_013516 [Fusarium sp. DS 682]|nr:hypothetical protein IL306_013516 [Fusarium sp. DS 682]